MELYPLTFTPIFKQRLWGGTKLNDLLHKNIPGKTTGESWEISALNHNVSQVANGSFAGTSLQTLIMQFPEKLLGARVIEQFGRNFPILIKFIDARENLSIQVHPNDSLAQKHHNASGKTEMWYVLHAEPGARLIAGFAKKTDKETCKQTLRKGHPSEILHYENVTRGDAFFIPSGTIHAIGAGVLLAEIQQTSDITYRVFDFNRKDKNGQLRELHTDLALEALDYSAVKNTKIPYSRVKNKANTIVNCPYFTTRFLQLTQNTCQNLAQRKAFTIYIVLEGQAQITNEAGTTTLKKGQTTLIPAATQTLSITTQNATLLEVIPVSI